MMLLGQEWGKGCFVRHGSRMSLIVLGTTDEISFVQRIHKGNLKVLESTCTTEEN